MKNISLTALCTFGLITALASCADISGKDDPTRDWSASKLHTEALKELKDGNYEKASKMYESLQSRYPYGVDSQEAELEQIYVYYKQKDAASTTTEADRFIKAHPNHPDVDYAYYLKGLANFNDDLGLWGLLYTESDIVQRDSKPARDSFDSFKELVQRFPNSRYAPDSIKRMQYIINSFAEKDVITARYYYRRSAYIAAVDRCQAVLNEYGTSTFVPEALYIMSQSYKKMGLTKLQQDTLELLKKNAPDSPLLVKGDPKLSNHWWSYLF